MTKTLPCIEVGARVLETGSRRRWGRRWASLTGVMALAAATAGCSATGGEIGDGDELSAQSEALTSDPWRNWSSFVANSALNVDPAICSNGTGYVLAIRNADEKYYVNRTYLTQNPEWKVVGRHLFASAPTCTMEFPYPGSDPRLLIAGKAKDDNRMYVAEGTLPAASQISAPNPDWTTSWHQVSSTQYSNGNYGRPALGSNGTKAVLVFLSAANKISAHSKNVPYSQGTWGAPAAAPDLPAGVSTTGIPAVAYIKGNTNKFAVMVRGIKNNVAGLYWIYFTGSAFEGSWTQAFAGNNTVSSDPAMEYDAVYNDMTVYFRSGNKVMQTSAARPPEIGLHSYYAIPNLPSTVIVGAPRVVFGGGVLGNRAAVVRGWDNNVGGQLFSSAYLITEVAGVPNPTP